MFDLVAKYSHYMFFFHYEYPTAFDDLAVWRKTENDLCGGKTENDENDSYDYANYFCMNRSCSFEP